MIDTDKFISRNKYLDNIQKDFMKRFFNKYPEQASLIDEWDFNIPAEKFLSIVKTFNRKNCPKDSIINLKENTDFTYLGTYEGDYYYHIKTHKGSVAIASNNIRPNIWSELPEWYKLDCYDYLLEDFSINDNFNFGINDTWVFGGAKWDIALKHTDMYWKRYTEMAKAIIVFRVSNKGKFLYILNDSLKLKSVQNQSGKVIFADKDDDYDINNFLEIDFIREKLKK